MLSQNHNTNSDRLHTIESSSKKFINIYPKTKPFFTNHAGTKSVQGNAGSLPTLPFDSTIVEKNRRKIM